MASDLISRNALLDSLRESVNWLHKIYDGLQYEDEKRICSTEIASFYEAILRVKDAPAVDAVEVVRCRDCALWKRVDEHCGKCPFLIGKHQYTVPYHYCSCGERREDNA